MPLITAPHIGRQDVLLEALSAAARANPVSPVSIDASPMGEAS